MADLTNTTFTLSAGNDLHAEGEQRVVRSCSPFAKLSNRERLLERETDTDGSTLGAGTVWAFDSGERPTTYQGTGCRVHH